MNRESINRVAAIAPVLLSLLAFGDVLLVVTTGWERQLSDEGSAAHLFQLLIVAQIPLIAVFLFTAKWRDAGRVVAILGAQVLALCLALGSIAYFGL